MINIFKRFWERYFIEIIVSVLGVIVALATAAINHQFSNDQIIILAITVGVDTICLSNKNLSAENHEHIKQELNSLKEIKELYQFFVCIPDEWKEIADEKINN